MSEMLYPIVYSFLFGVAISIVYFSYIAKARFFFLIGFAGTILSLAFAFFYFTKVPASALVFTTLSSMMLAAVGGLATGGLKAYFDGKKDTMAFSCLLVVMLSALSWLFVVAAIRGL